METGAIKQSLTHIFKEIKLWKFKSNNLYERDNTYVALSDGTYL